MLWCLLTLLILLSKQELGGNRELNPMNKNEVLKRLKWLKVVHALIFICFILAAASLIWVSRLTIYLSVAAVFVAVIQLQNNRKCPLTVYEQDLNKKLGVDKPDNEFATSLIQEFLGIKLPNFIISFIMIFIFGGSTLYLLIYLYRGVISLVTPLIR